jgi:hypothetical protein
MYRTLYGAVDSGTLIVILTFYLFCSLASMLI